MPGSSLGTEIWEGSSQGEWVPGSVESGTFLRLTPLSHQHECVMTYISWAPSRVSFQRTSPKLNCCGSHRRAVHLWLPYSSSRVAEPVRACHPKGDILFPYLVED